MNEERTRGWLSTFTGKRIFPLDPRPEQIDIRDIAHALSNLCRFGGHCMEFYSVAQHSVLVSHLVPSEIALHGLLHDAGEAYLLDIPRPLKAEMPFYIEAEERLQEVIAARFGICSFRAFRVGIALGDIDTRVLAAELRELVNISLEDLPHFAQAEPLPDPISPLPPRRARELFLTRFFRLYRPTRRQL